LSKDGMNFDYIKPTEEEIFKPKPKAQPVVKKNNASAPVKQ